MLLRPACRFILGLVGALACLAGVVGPAFGAPAQGGAAPGIGAGAEGAAPSRGTEGSVVVVGFSGVSWKDVTADTAPNLYRFGKQASTADLVVRTINETTCPTEGWLTLGAGQRTIDDAPACRPPKARSRWTELVEVNSASKYHARLGRLGKALRNAKTTAIGPGAAMALTDPKGRLRADYADLAPIPGSVRGTSAGAADDSGAAAKAYLEKAAGSKVTVVDLGAVRRPESQLSASGGGRPGFWRRLGGFFASEPSASRDVTAQISALDARFASLLRAIREKDPKATVLAASLADSQSSRPSLGYFAAAGPRVARGMTLAGGPPLTASSDATRQRGYVQITDLMPTLLDWAAPGSSEAADAIGSTIVSTPNGSGEENVRELVGNEVRSQTVRSLSGPFFILLGAMFAAVLALFLTRSRWKGTTRRLFVQLSTLLAAVPVASLLVNLVPWWYSPRAAGVFVGLLVTFSTLIAALALNPRWKDRSFAPFGVIGGLVVVTLMLDVAFDDVLAYPLQLAALFGTQPLVGWRFYGFSNSAFALFTAGLILFLAWAGERLYSRGERRKAAWLIVAVGAVAVFLDGSAGYGADFGGPPVLIVALGTLAMMIFRRRLTCLRIAAVLFLALVVSTAFAVADYLSPVSERSHLGRFVETVLHGNGLEIVARKLAQVFGNLPWPAIALLVAALGAAAYWTWRLHRRGGFRIGVLARSRAWNELPVLRMSVIVLCWALVVGMFVNDSGILVPAMGLAFSIPLWCVAVVRFEEADPLGSVGAGSQAPAGDCEEAREKATAGEGASTEETGASRPARESSAGETAEEPPVAGAGGSPRTHPPKAL